LNFELLRLCRNFEFLNFDFLQGTGLFEHFLGGFEQFKILSNSGLWTIRTFGPFEL